MATQDNRKEPRFPIGVDVPARWAPLAEPVWLPASDISANGIFLDIPTPPPAQTPIMLGPPDAQVRGQVVFVLLPEVAAKIGRSPGVGVQLAEAMDVEAWLLRVAEHRAETRTVASIDAIPLPGGSPTAIPLPGGVPLPLPLPLPLPGASLPVPLPGASKPVPLPGASVPLPGASVPLPGSDEPALAGAQAHMPEKFERAVPMPSPASPLPMPTVPRKPPPGPAIRAAIVPAADKSRSAADAARRMARVPDATDAPAGAEVLIVTNDAAAGETLKAALIADEYTVIIARHGLEALALCVRRQPLIAIVPANMPRLSAALFLRELRSHPELAEMRVIVVDDGKGALDPRASARWPKVPDTVQAARRQIDLVAEGVRGKARPRRGKEDAHELAAMIKGLALRWADAGDLTAAALALRYVVELTPSSFEHAALLAWTLFQSNPDAYNEALGIVERVLRQQPAYAQAWFYKGAMVKRRGKVSDGDDLLKRALMYEPGHAAARAELERVPTPEPDDDMASAMEEAAPQPDAAGTNTVSGFLRRLFGGR